jgi:hypothetical protein
MYVDPLPYQDSLQNMQRYVVRLESYLAALAPQMKVAENQMLLRLLDDQISYVGSLMGMLQQAPCEPRQQEGVNSWCVLFFHLQALRGLVAGEPAAAPRVPPALNVGYSIPIAVQARRSVA